MLLFCIIVSATTCTNTILHGFSGENDFPVDFLFIPSISTLDITYNYSKDRLFNLMDLANIQKWVNNRNQHRSTQDVLLWRTGP